jgi:hypothetical protein
MGGTRVPESGRDDLTPTASDVLSVAEHTAGFSTGAGVSKEAFVRDMLTLAGVRDIDRIEILACSWPTDLALDVVHAFFRQDGSLAKLRSEHLESEASALRAFEIVRVALFELLGRYVLPRHHKHAVRFASALQEDDFEELSSIVRGDLRDQRDGKPWSVATYLAGIYVRTLLRDDAVAEYFPNAVWTEAVRRVAAVVDDGAARLLADVGGTASDHR